MQDLESMQYLMRYNKFQTDVYANGDPWAVSPHGSIIMGYV